MLLSSSVFIKMNGKHVAKYIEKGYMCKTNEIVEIKIEDLLLESHAIISAKCDVCGNEKNIKYQVYNKSFKNGNYYSCSIKCGLGKFRKNNLEKYGVDNYSKTDECKIKTKETCLRKYGSITPSGNIDVMNKMIATRINRGNQNNSQDINEYSIYRKLVRKLTDANKKTLFESWSGYDHYDGEFIRDNFDLNSNNRMYPTIDHKISIYYGYNNNISAEKIASLCNLCITKRGINSSKNIKTDEIFRKL